MKSQRVTKKQKRLIYIFRALSVRIFAVIMVLGGLLGLIFFVRPDTSEVEKRTLTEFPKPTLSSLWNGEFFSDLSLWYSDTYPMRDQLIAADHKLESAYGVKTSTMMVGNQKQSDDIPDADAKKASKKEEKQEEKRSPLLTAGPWRPKSRTRFRTVCTSKTELPIQSTIMTRTLQTSILQL